MRFRSMMRIGCILLVFLLGCVTKSQFNAVSNDFHLAQQEISDGQKKMDELHYALRNAKEDADLCRKAQARLQEKIKISNTEKQSVSQQIEELNHTIKKQKAVVALQETVIRLLDDSKQTIQNSIKEQIAAQNLETSTSSSPIKSGPSNESVH